MIVTLLSLFSSLLDSLGSRAALQAEIFGHSNRVAKLEKLTLILDVATVASVPFWPGYREQAFIVAGINDSLTRTQLPADLRGNCL